MFEKIAVLVGCPCSSDGSTTVSVTQESCDVMWSPRLWILRVSTSFKLVYSVPSCCSTVSQPFLEWDDKQNNHPIASQEDLVEASCDLDLLAVRPAIDAEKDRDEAPKPKEAAPNFSGQWVLLKIEGLSSSWLCEGTIWRWRFEVCGLHMVAHGCTPKGCDLGHVGKAAELSHSAFSGVLMPGDFDAFMKAMGVGFVSRSLAKSMGYGVKKVHQKVEHEGNTLKVTTTNPKGTKTQSLLINGEEQDRSEKPPKELAIRRYFRDEARGVRREADMQIREAEHRHRAELAAEQERVREAHDMVTLVQFRAEKNRWIIWIISGDTVDLG
eukprot:Skav204393  [mRNA]  locus=scaffold2947:125573:129858:+ [translate_table: standard]